MKKSIAASLCILMICVTASAQEKDSSESRLSRMDLVYGLTFQSAWTSVEGSDLPGNYFYKPSVGGMINLEFYIFKYLGVGAAFGYQQKGMGIKNADEVNTIGNPDSTYRERVRFHCWDIPLYLTLRSPDIFKGVRISGKFGASYSMNTKTTWIFHSVEDGFHGIQDQSSDYYKNDVNYIGCLGFDINAGPKTVFQVQFFVHQGTKNIYNNESRFGNAVGMNRAYGLQLGFFY